VKQGNWMAGAALLAGLCVAGLSGVASAAPSAAGLNLQPAVTEVMSDIHDFHNFILPILVVVSVLVLVLLLWVMVRYNRRANPTPRSFTHNMTVEVIWTVLPVLILVAIAWKSFPLLYKAERIPPAEITLKVTGNSWFWTYEYPDLGVNISSVMLQREDAEAQGRPYLLSVDTPLVVPMDTNVRVLVTSNDVIHSFAMPAFGVKEDAIQGRVNETWFRVESDLVGENNVFFGQCSELCGQDHAFMPIEIHAVPRAEFDQWVLAQGGALAQAQPAPAALTPAAAASPASPNAAAQSALR